jgi:hypothetical protein
MGWDVLVEFRFPDETSGQPLDSRPKPLVCRVQVKTIWWDNDSAKAPLQALEMLAKAPEPAFICIMKMAHDCNPTELFLIHLIDHQLAKVLKRLRVERARGSTHLKGKTMKFSRTAMGRPIAPTGAAVKAALETAIGSDLSGYIDRKRDQLRSLGYESGSHRAKFEMTVDGHRQLVDVFLGLRPATVKHLRHFENRFNIELPMERLNAERAELHVDPKPKADCEIVFRPAGGGRPARFPGKLYTALLPGMAIEHLGYRVDTESFEFIGRWAEGTLNSKQGIELTPQAWGAFHRGLKILSQHHATVEVIVESKTPLRMTVGGGFDGDPEYHDDMEHLCGDVAKVLDLCGGRDMRFRSEAIFDARAHVWPLLALFDPAPGAGLSIPTNLMKNYESLPRRANVYKAFCIGDVALAYYVTVELEVETDGDGLVWRSTVIEPGEVTVLSGHENDYQDFVEQTRARTGVDLLFVGEWKPSQSSSASSTCSA